MNKDQAQYECGNLIGKPLEYEQDKVTCIINIFYELVSNEEFVLYGKHFQVVQDIAQHEENELRKHNCFREGLQVNPPLA